MPVTPFHFGPGAAIQAVAPRHVSFLAFCAANVLVAPFSDANPLYRVISLRALHWLCVGAGAFALVVMSVRRGLSARDPT